MKNVEKTTKELIEKVKTQTEQLWNTIQEAKKSNLIVRVGLDTNGGKIVPEISITETVYSQGLGSIL